jgi:1-phosphofructokinase
LSGVKSPIITLTPSPTLDRTYFLKKLVEGGVNRAHDVNEELAGKGINVSRALELAEISAPGVVPIGNADPAVLERTGSTSFLEPLWVDGTLRVSTTIIEDNGPTTKVNEHPRPLKQADWEEVVSLTLRLLKENEAEWLVVAGAHPKIIETDEVIDLVPLFDQAKAMGVKVVLDTSGDPLRYWARKGVATIMKPNGEELASCVGRTLNTLNDVVDAARELNSWGVECVLASLGVDGMLAVTKTDAVHAFTPPVRVINTVGAGDSTVAGFLSAVTLNKTDDKKLFGVGFDIAKGVKEAVRWGGAKVQQPTSGLKSIENLPIGVVMEKPDLTASLREPAEFEG